MKNNEDCEYCRDGKYLIDDNDCGNIIEAYIDSDELVAHGCDGYSGNEQHKKINFCPVCGRRLSK